jgi:hypothetical protein
MARAHWQLRRWVVRLKGEVMAGTPPEPKPRRRVRKSSASTRHNTRANRVWRERVGARVVLLRVQLERIEDVNSSSDDTSFSAVEDLLASAEQTVSDAACRSWRSRLTAWWNGSDIERAWREIHDAETLLAEWRPLVDLNAERTGLLSLARAALPKDDAQRKAIEDSLAGDLWPKQGVQEDLARAQYVAALSYVFEASDEQYTRVRSFRNILLVTTLFLAVLAGGLLVLGTQRPGALPMCFSATTTTTTTTTTKSGTGGAANSANPLVCPTGSHGDSRGGDIALVELLGIVGAGLAAAFALRNIRGTSTPYAVPVALAMLKIPAGALTAIIGLLFIEAGFAPGLSNLDSQPQILAYAILFGYAQQIITRLVDQQGQTLLNKAPPDDQPAGLKTG